MSEPMNPYDSPEFEKPGMSGTTKVLLVFGIGFGVLGLLCCGGLGVGGYMAVRMLKDSTSTDPEVVKRVTAEIASITVPEALEPKMSMDMQVPFTDKKFMRMVTYTDVADDSVLWLAEFNADIGDSEQMESQFRKSMEDGGQRRTEDLKVTESEKYEAEINGKPGKFTISKGIEESSQDEYFEVLGHFEGKSGPAMLVLRVRSPQFSKDDVMNIVKSIK